MDAKHKRGRWIALGTVAGLALAWGGFGVLGAAATGPARITTCTTLRTGKLKVIATSAVAKCTKNGKGVATNWDNHTTVVSLANQLATTQGQLTTSQHDAVAAARYHTLMFGSTVCGGSTNDFAGMSLTDVYLPVCLSGVDLSHANLNGAHLEGVALANANLSSASIHSFFADSAIFWNANLSDADLAGANLYQSEFNNANLTDANLSSAVLRFADLTGATMSGADVTGVTWDRTKCPDGTRSDTNGTVPQSCLGHL